MTTDDGYVLGTYRIPGPRPDRGGAQGPPSRVVLLQHGLLDSSATWALEPDTSLAFLLADRGWDVWLGNSRGNAFSRNHTGLDPRGPAFWSFSLDDMAAHDLPALVRYVRGVTGAARIAYVGHSQGATIALAGLASSAELRGSLAAAVLLAPAASLRHIDSVPMRALAALRADELFTLLGVTEFMPNQKEVSELFEALCRATPEVCVSALTAICGFSTAHVNSSRLWHYVAYAPSGARDPDAAAGVWAGAHVVDDLEGRPVEPDTRARHCLLRELVAAVHARACTRTRVRMRAHVHAHACAQVCARTRARMRARTPAQTRANTQTSAQTSATPLAISKPFSGWTGTSTMNMEHWAQMVRAARAAPGEDLRLPMYDWGTQCESAMGVPQSCNRRVYGSETAPVYDMSAVRGVPLALFWGGSDKLAGPLDVAILSQALPPETLKLALVGGIGKRKRGCWRGKRRLGGFEGQSIC